MLFRSFSLNDLHILYVFSHIDAVIITSPNYYGICCDIKNTAEECHAKNIPLLVDEAHGAHFIASNLFPQTAVKYADAVCQSAHKTLNAMNGSSYLHINGDLIDRKRLEKSLYMFSPTLHRRLIHLLQCPPMTR